MVNIGNYVISFDISYTCNIQIRWLMHDHFRLCSLPLFWGLTTAMAFSKLVGEGTGILFVNEWVICECMVILRLPKFNKPFIYYIQKRHFRKLCFRIQISPWGYQRIWFGFSIQAVATRWEVCMHLFPALCYVSMNFYPKQRRNLEVRSKVKFIHTDLRT